MDKTHAGSVPKIMEKRIEGSRFGLWNARYAKKKHKRMYGDVLTAKKAAEFFNLDDIHQIEDWGCGFGGFRDFIARHQTYIGVDGSDTRFADKIVDLETYQSSVDAVHLRHVLEHNPGWEKILENALASFTKRMVLTIFTPFEPTTKVIAEYPEYTGTDIIMVDLSLNRDDLVSRFEGLDWSSDEGLVTKTQYNIEHIFYLEKPGWRQV